ncbi:uncharacterized protein LOC143248657 [Tachypleus tridentatus]
MKPISMGESDESHLARLNNTTTAATLDNYLPPGHKAILEMHANSQSNAIIYVMVVLLLYALALVVVVIKYVRTERYESRLTSLYDTFIQRDMFVRLSKRQQGVPTTAATPIVDGVDDNVRPHSPTSRSVPMKTTDEAVSKV